MLQHNPRILPERPKSYIKIFLIIDKYLKLHSITDNYNFLQKVTGILPTKKEPYCY